jgi:hypothetical protein
MNTAPCLNRIHTCSHVLGVLLLFTSEATILAQGNFKAAIPPAFANKEGKGSASPFGSPRRTQSIYNSSLFLEAMPQGGFITQVAFRVEGPNGNVPVDVSIPDLEVHMSTTRTSAADLIPGSLYAPHVGADDTVVFPRGSLHWVAPWSPNGPNPFDLKIPLAVPFKYDPAAGNLLLELFIYQMSNPGIRLDVDTVPGSTMEIEGSLTSDRSSDFLGGAPLIIQVSFSPIPEPTPLILTIMGAILVIALKRMRR